ncbi:MAG: UDP-N-acetylmuramate dehydrogenase [Saprospiraceae bacterium]|nr:UDP-N-acetylmuramate dehydrogenase [Saprospiraceae bacterium]
MRLYVNYLLRKENTFGIDATASSLIKIKSTDALKRVLRANKLPVYILGGGSNILLMQTHYKWLFLKNAYKGIKIVENGVYTEGVAKASRNKNVELKSASAPSEIVEYRIKIKNSPLIETNSKDILVEIGGGELWHDLVIWAVRHNFGGVENLSLIPGTVGAAPIQNIGAYGVELKDVFVKLEAFNLTTHETRVFTAEECQFGYRDSIFKNELKGQYLITKVYLRLTTPSFHKLTLHYGDIQKILDHKGIEYPTIKQISDIVIGIRQSKLPDPTLIGNAGSFFKNPTISVEQFNALKTKFPEIVGNVLADNTVKVAAGWLIEAAGWKGKRLGEVGVHERQALVLVNYGGGTGENIKALAAQIQQSIVKKFGITLVAEVNEV